VSLVLKKLSDFCKTSSGGTPSRSTPEFFENGNIPWIKSGELKNRYVTEVEEKITQLAVNSSSAKIVPKGALLIAMYGATVGEVSQLLFDATTNQAVCSIVPDDSLCDVNYLYRYLQAQKDNLLNLRVGGGQPNISQGIIKDLIVPLPPLEEQRRIASILDKADNIRQKRQQAIAKLDELLQATFIDMFGDPIKNEKGWIKKPLSELVVIDAPLVDPNNDEHENLLHYGPDRISKDTGQLLPALTAKEDMLISKKFLCDGRHILYSKIRPYLNKVALVKEKCLCSADVYPVEPRSCLKKYFLWNILRSNSFLEHAETFSNRANIPKINRQQFLQYECIVPSLEVQSKFEKIAQHLENERNNLLSQQYELDNLFKALQQKAFNGTL
jgi:type I restriction enzyme S subunit